jgi:hypothetical protein
MYYDGPGASDTLQTGVDFDWAPGGADPDPTDVELSYAPVSTDPFNGCDAGEEPAMILTVKKESTDATLNFNGMHINGEFVGDFAAGTTWGDSQWTFYGVDFTEEFSAHGFIEVDGLGSASNSEANKVEMQVVCIPPAP